MEVDQLLATAAVDAPRPLEPEVRVAAARVVCAAEVRAESSSQIEYREVGVDVMAGSRAAAVDLDDQLRRAIRVALRQM